MTLSELILEYVSVSKRVDTLTLLLEKGSFYWRQNQDGIELEERLSELQGEFRKHGLHTVAIECALTENQLNVRRIRQLRKKHAA